MLGNHDIPYFSRQHAVPYDMRNGPSIAVACLSHDFRTKMSSNSLLIFEQPVMMGEPKEKAYPLQSRRFPAEIPRAVPVNNVNVS